MHHYDFEFLRDCRKLSGLTIAELAERAGIHEVTLARIEGGLRCAPDTLKRIVGATIDALDEREAAIGKALSKLRSRKRAA